MDFNRFCELHCGKQIHWCGLYLHRSHQCHWGGGDAGEFISHSVFCICILILFVLVFASKPSTQLKWRRCRWMSSPTLHLYSYFGFHLYLYCHLLQSHQCHRSGGDVCENHRLIYIFVFVLVFWSWPGENIAPCEITILVKIANPVKNSCVHRGPSKSC